MRTVALILLLAMVGRAEDRTAMLDRILTTEAGTPVRVRLDDRTMVTGRLLRVENETVHLQVAEAGVIRVRELPVARIASFEVARASEFGKGVRKGAGRAVGAMGVLIGIGLLISLANH